MLSILYTLASIALFAVGGALLGVLVSILMFHD